MLLIKIISPFIGSVATLTLLVPIVYAFKKRKYLLALIFLVTMLSQFVNTLFMTVKDQLKQADLNDLERYILLQFKFDWVPSWYILSIAKFSLLLSISSSFLDSMLAFGVVEFIFHVTYGIGTFCFAILQEVEVKFLFIICSTIPLVTSILLWFIRNRDGFKLSDHKALFLHRIIPGIILYITAIFCHEVIKDLTYLGSQVCFYSFLSVSFTVLSGYKYKMTNDQ